jgi:hypothetical protein
MSSIRWLGRKLNRSTSRVVTLALLETTAFTATVATF